MGKLGARAHIKEKMMMFEFSYSHKGITLKAKSKQVGFLRGLFAKEAVKSIDELLKQDSKVAFAVADLQALSDEEPGSLSFEADRLLLTHRLAARLDANTAMVLGLPPIVDLILRTDVEGVVGSSGFRLRHEWVKNGQRQLPQRVGCILQTANGLRRIPLWVLEAVEIAEGHSSQSDDARDWEALARFRQALDPGLALSSDTYAARISMTDFLTGLEVKLADRFSISPSETRTDFDIVPFSARRLESEGFESDNGDITESSGELHGGSLQLFQERIRERGALSAYRVSPGSYLVVDRSVLPVLQVMAEMQQAPEQERAAFIQNPRQRISEAVERFLRDEGRLEGLQPSEEEELIESCAGPAFIETHEFSQRVIGISVFQKPDFGPPSGSGTTWLPEEFARKIEQALGNLSKPELEDLQVRVDTAIESGEESVALDDLALPARVETSRMIEERIARTEVGAEENSRNEEQNGPIESGPLVLETADNFTDLKWQFKVTPRHCSSSDVSMPELSTRLKEHQERCLDWEISAWKVGLPGVLNADEQGLGKTLETIAFLAWLKKEMVHEDAHHRGPVLVVAPTSLLENWEQEVAQHLKEPGLGHLIRLYGSAVAGRKVSGAVGRDTDSGEIKLDFSALHEAIEEGRAHRFWILTTYTTLTNYQHSLARIPFSTIVFDEIQALKNPGSLRAAAARAMQADFRIGLTGTPIENSVTDLWAIMDQLVPGALDTMTAFRKRYETPNDQNMAELYSEVFQARGGLVPLAMRRLKETVATDLPAKVRMLHPRLMPEVQASAYEDARLKLASRKPGSALKVLHHIRTVSVHPALHESESDSDFIAASARLQAALDILRSIHQKGERALVFIEHRQMQYRFISLVKAVFNLDKVDLINGDTPIQQRQGIVNRFQQHQVVDGGFDLLILGPKAAGTGLTLTAATHVIHLSRWWNPAVEEQCNDRVHRLGQTKGVAIHLPMAIHPNYREHSFDCLLHSLMQRKRRLASSALWPMGDTDADVGELQKMLNVDVSMNDKLDDVVRSALLATFVRDGAREPVFSKDGSITYD